MAGILLIKLSSTLALCQKIGLSMLAYKGKKFLLDPEINLSSQRTSDLFLAVSPAIVMGLIRN